jgi:hypothetical protein
MNRHSNAQTEAAVSPDLLLQPLRFLLRRYGRTPSPKTAGKIARYVDQLLDDRNFQIPPHERCAYRRMQIYWRLLERLE